MRRGQYAQPSESNLTPAEDRGTLIVRISKFSHRHQGKQITQDITAKETVCSFLAVNPSPILGPVSEFNLTHIPTGYSLIHGFPDERTAELCAGAISQIFEWDIESDSRDLRRRFSMLPPKLQRWIKNWKFL